MAVSQEGLEARMPSQIDPSGVEARTVLGAADFRSARVLEIGSGNARLTFPIAKVARSVIGIDVKHADLASDLPSCRNISSRRTIRVRERRLDALPWRSLRHRRAGVLVVMSGAGGHGRCPARNLAGGGSRLHHPGFAASHRTTPRRDRNALWRSGAARECGCVWRR